MRESELWLLFVPGSSPENVFEDGSRPTTPTSYAKSWLPLAPAPWVRLWPFQYSPIRRSLACAGKSKPPATGGPAATSCFVTVAGCANPAHEKLKIIWLGDGEGVTMSLAVAKFHSCVA